MKNIFKNTNGVNINLEQLSTKGVKWLPIKDIFKNTNEVNINLEQLSTKGVSKVDLSNVNVEFLKEEDYMLEFKKFLYNIGDMIILRDDIDVGTLCGGVEFTDDHKRVRDELQTLIIRDRIIDEYGKYYTLDGFEMVITDVMVDQIKTKDLQSWLFDLDDLNSSIKKYDTKPLKVIIGRTASGKDTFAKQFTDVGLTLVKTYTTRPRREGEGYTHKFIRDVKGYNPLWAHSKINGYDYFILPEDVVDSDVIILDPRGLDSLLSEKEFTRDIEVYYLFAESYIRRERYLNRDGSDEEDFHKRNDAEYYQFSEFEKRIQNKEFRDMYNITVLASKSIKGEPYFLKLYI